MNRCLCCEKPFGKQSSLLEQANGWHFACSRNFFGCNIPPTIDISENVLRQLAIDSANKGYTVPGVQKKLSLHLSTEEDGRSRLTLVNYPTGYILKPQTDEYVALPEMEHLIMHMAVKTGIQTVPFALVQLPSQQDAFAYITRRIDRAQGQMLAMEDFCQLDGRLTEDKYRGSYERCGKIVMTYSQNALLDLAELFLRVVFSFAVGNSDMHLKNFSLIETAEGNGVYRLSEAYDMISSNVVIPKDREELALTINGKKQNIRKKDFLVFADTIGLSPKVAEKMIQKVIKLEDTYITMCQESYMMRHQKEALEALIRARIDRLK